MTQWERIPFRETVNFPLHWYRGCRVKLKRKSGTFVVGTFQSGNHDHITIEGIYTVDAYTGDELWWDLDGPRPKVEWTQEEFALAKVLYEANPHTDMAWEGTFGLAVRVDYLYMAREALKWCDSPKMVMSADPESDDLDGSELQLAVAKKLAEYNGDTWDLAKRDHWGKKFMDRAQQIIDLINREQGTD